MGVFGTWNAPDGLEGTSVGVQTIRRLEEAGVQNLEDLAQIRENDLVRLGIRRDLAKQIEAYVVRCSQ